MRVLVTGGSGGLGRYVTRALLARDATVLAPRHEDLDVTKSDDFRAYVESVKPTAVMHLAALANVDHCAERPEEAVAVNGVATHRLARDPAPIRERDHRDFARNEGEQPVPGHEDEETDHHQDPERERAPSIHR